MEQEKFTMVDKLHHVESNKSAEIAELKINLESLQKSLEELRENSMKLVEEKANLEQEYQAVVLKKSDVEQQTLDSLEKLRIIQMEKQALEEESNSQKVTNEELRLQVEQKTSENNALNESLLSSTNEIDSMKKEMEKVEQKLQVSLLKMFFHLITRFNH